MSITSFRGNYHFLSNFSPYKIIITDTKSSYKGTWKTAEHLFQAMKTQDASYINAIYNTDNPKDAKKLGREAPLRSNWNDVKDDVMYFVVKEKFTQNLDIQKKLIETGDEELVEGNWWGDTYWGVCNGKGLNKLGKILMQVRSKLISK